MTKKEQKVADELLDLASRALAQNSPNEASTMVHAYLALKASDNHYPGGLTAAAAGKSLDELVSKKEDETP